MTYIRCFCAGDIDGLAPLLATDLSFTGTLHSYRSASEYLASLQNDPPDKCEYKVLSITDSDDAVAVFYEYLKPEQVIQIAQLFNIKHGKIHRILLIFDGRNFV